MKTIRFFFFLLNIAFPQLVSTFVLWMNCTPLSSMPLPEGSTPFQSDVGFHTLRPYSECVLSQQYALAMPMLLLYGIAFPLFLLNFTPLVRGLRQGQRNFDWDGRLDFRFLFGMYKQDRMWWAGAVLAVRFCVPLFLQAFDYQSTTSTFLLFFLLVVSGGCQAFFRPFASERDNVLSCLSLLTLVVTYFFAILRQNDTSCEQSDSMSSLLVMLLNVLTLFALAACFCLDHCKCVRRFWRCFDHRTHDITAHVVGSKSLQVPLIDSESVEGDVASGDRRDEHSPAALVMDGGDEAAPDEPATMRELRVHLQKQHQAQLQEQQAMYQAQLRQKDEQLRWRDEMARHAQVDAGRDVDGQAAE